VVNPEGDGSFKTLLKKLSVLKSRLRKEPDPVERYYLAEKCQETYDRIARLDRGGNIDRSLWENILSTTTTDEGSTGPSDEEIQKEEPEHLNEPPDEDKKPPGDRKTD